MNAATEVRARKLMRLLSEVADTIESIRPEEFNEINVFTHRSQDDIFEDVLDWAQYIDTQLQRW